MFWQDPGYRTLKQFISFGESVFNPVYSGVMGIWDSLYSTMWADGFLSGIGLYSSAPPWNYTFMAAGMWWSLLPAAMILTGLLSVMANPAASLRQGSLFAASCVVVYFSAIFYLFLVVPIYSIGKATYTLGLIPCYAVLCAGGFDRLLRGPLARAALHGFLACWAFNAYFTFWVI
jgi:hypothetical protein